MGLFQKLHLQGTQDIDWDMTPDFTFGTYESWGGVERVRSPNERVYYFFIDAWDDKPKLCLMERGIKHAEIIAEIAAPQNMVVQCVDEQGKVALFERTHPINSTLKDWLLENVINTSDDSKIIPVVGKRKEVLGRSGLPGKDEALSFDRVDLTGGAGDLAEDDVIALCKHYNLVDHERNPGGTFVNCLVDNGDGKTVTDKVTSLMWQRKGIDIMSNRSMRKAVKQVNAEQYGGYSDWRLPTMAEALSLIEQEKVGRDQYIHPCFSGEQPFVFVDATRKPGGYWFVDFKQGKAFWSSGTIPGGFGRLCRRV